ncbi:hypothetical protein [Chryseobacterium sp.]|uniref:hypothetical protein n=1 Tax=Chryseobacterium sp. TaxID=1871047 RepID=UPI00289825B4|nr:hypothetical protein [Chryseobacterium sp.]
MRIDFKLTRPTVIAVNVLLSNYDIVQFDGLRKNEKIHYSMRLELRNIFIKKTMSCHPAKEFKMKLNYYLAEELMKVLTEYFVSGHYNNGLEMLKNQLHPKLL